MMACNLLRVVFLLVGSAVCTAELLQCANSQSCSDSVADQTSLLQAVQSQGNLGNAHPAKRKMHRAMFAMVQALTDLDLNDIDSDHDGISKSDWDAAFDRLDTSGDGKLDFHDLEKNKHGKLLSGKRKRREENSNNAKASLTKEDYRAALATLTEWFPQILKASILYEDIIVSAAWNNMSVPTDAPRVDHLIKEQVSLSEAEREAELAELKANLDPCMSKVLSFTLESVSFFITLASGGSLGWLGSVLHKSESGVIRALKTSAQHALIDLGEQFVSAYAESNAMGMSTVMASVFQELWSQNIFAVVLQEAYYAMSWWDWVTSGVSLVATLTAWFASGGLLLAAQIAVTILSAGNLIQAGLRMSDTCSSDSPGGNHSEEAPGNLSLLSTSGTRPFEDADEEEEVF